MSSGEGSLDFVRVVVAYFLPPVGVFLQVGLGTAFWINLVLTLLVPWLGGVLHAMWVIASVGPEGKASPEPMATFVALILAGFLPPVAVLMRGGVLQALLNLVLCIFWVPGVLHAVWVVVNQNSD